MDRKTKAKLSLKRETLRKLDDDLLAQVAGGTITLYTIGSLVIATIGDCVNLSRVGTTVSCVTNCQ